MCFDRILVPGATGGYWRNRWSSQRRSLPSWSLSDGELDTNQLTEEAYNTIASTVKCCKGKWRMVRDGEWWSKGWKDRKGGPPGKGLSAAQFAVVCCLLYVLSKHLINAGLRPLVLLCSLLSLGPRGFGQPELQMHHPGVCICDGLPAGISTSISGLMVFREAEAGSWNWPEQHSLSAGWTTLCCPLCTNMYF